MKALFATCIFLAVASVAGVGQAKPAKTKPAAGAARRAAPAPPAEPASTGPADAPDPGGGATAAPAEPPQGTPSVQDTAPVKLRDPVLTAGTKRRFRMVSTVETPTADGVRTRRNTQTIELEVQPAAKGKPKLVRYVIAEGSAENDSLGRAMLASSKGIPTDFEADRTGKPLRIPDWARVRETILERLALDPAAPPDAQARVKPALMAMDPVAAISFAVPEVLMIADMQGWGALTPGRHDEPPASISQGGAKGQLVSWREVGAPDAKTCSVQLKRATEIDPAAAGDAVSQANDRLETTAAVSTLDGWVVSLSQVKTRRTGSGAEVRTWTVTREEPPACPAS